MRALSIARRGLTAADLREEPGGRSRARSKADGTSRGAELGALLTRAGISRRRTGWQDDSATSCCRRSSTPLVCSGAREARSATYALVDDGVARHEVRSTRDEALATLAPRYFRSHGPALVADFAWWSGLTVRDAKAAIALVTPALETRCASTAATTGTSQRRRRAPPAPPHACCRTSTSTRSPIATAAPSLLARSSRDARRWTRSPTSSSSTAAWRDVEAHGSGRPRDHRRRARSRR